MHASLAPLTGYAQFILWRMTHDGKKLPVDYRTGRECSAHDRGAWLPYDTARYLINDDHRLGFVLTADDPFFFLDIDDCLTPTGWSPLAVEVLAQLPGAAVEVSHSGRGLHVIGSGAVPPHACKNATGGLELYTELRFIAITETNAVGSASTDCSAYLTGVVARYFPPRTGAGESGPEWTDEPCAEWSGPDDDDELLKRALRAKSSRSTFGSACSFADLWRADPDALGVAYPDDHGARAYNASSADAALAQHLAFWTGKNHARIQSLMERSSLKRDKWDREDYLPRTILRAVSMQGPVYAEHKPKVPLAEIPTTAARTPELVTGMQYLDAVGATRVFEGCVYIQDMHRVFLPSGAMLKAEQFNATFGGYLFQLDDTGKTTRKAWDAFTESQVVRFPKAEGTCFRPALASGAIIDDEGRRLVNVYVPVETKRAQGDPSPFLDHLARVLPVAGDRAILLAYMAACVQHRGIKFQWCPLLQGAEGNGKTLFTRCVAFAVGRKYTHYPKAGDIDNKFNGWLLNKLLIGIEDIYVPEHRREVIETLKPMITGGDGLEIQMKGVDQITADICANFMLNSNHKDAIRKTTTDRRFAVFYTAQQEPEDLASAGMTGDYFPRLYAWLRGGGYAVVSEYLHTYAIPEELNPAGACHRAPDTSSTGEAVRVSLGGVEQEINEAIDEGRMGFAGGWVSSMALDRLLQNMRAARAVPPNRRRAMMQSLGYDWHPALSSGRVNVLVPIDNGKPRLFVRRGHLAANLTNPADVVRAYEKAQTEVIGSGSGAVFRAGVGG